MSAQKNGRRSGPPDGSDVQAVIDAIYREFGAAAELSIYAGLAGDLAVEALTKVLWSDQEGEYLTHVRLAHPGGPPLLGVCLQALHALYHDLDRRRLAREKIRAQALAE